MKKAVFLIYAWGTTILFAGLIYWLSTIPNFQTGDQVYGDLIKVIFKMVLYAILFILLYRSIIITLKSTVERLSSFRSKGEKAEDAEFVLIIETVVVLFCMVSCILFSFLMEYTQFYVNGRNGNLTYLIDQGDGTFVNSSSIALNGDTTYVSLTSIADSSKDILISTMSVLLTGIVVYSLPVIGELEIAIKHKLAKEFSAFRSRKNR